LGKNRYQMFDVAHVQAVKTQLESLERVRCALSGQEFRCITNPR
jgi:hypothetical protein